MSDAPHSLVPAPYADQLDTDCTARFDALEAPADRSRRELLEASKAHTEAHRRLSAVVDKNRLEHERFRARIAHLERSWQIAPRRALLVDDNQPLRFAICKMLEKLDFEEVDQAEDYEGARTLVQTKRYDLIITDVRLRGGDVGLDIVAIVREESIRPLVPILVISGRDPGETDAAVASKLTGEELERWSDRSGATDCLEKPFTFEELSSMVHKLMRDATPRTGLRRIPR